MLAGIDFNQVLTFPFKDMLSRRYFIYGCGIALAGFVIPVIPHLILLGYVVILVKQVLNNETLHMPAWDNWGEMLKDGARLFGVRLVYIIPILILGIPFFGSMIALPLAAEIESEGLFLTSLTILVVSMCLITPISLPLAVIIPAAELYAVEKESFSAAFRFREWWGILRANIGGFIAAVAIVYVISMLMGIIVQIIIATLILACLLPFVMPAVTVYSMLVMYVMFAQAYKVGRDKLAVMEVKTVVGQ